MSSNSETEIHIYQQIIISKLMEENNQLKKNQLKEIENKDEENNSSKFDFQLLQRELHELILKNNKEERVKKEDENNLLKFQMEAQKKENKDERAKREEENKLQKSQMNIKEERVKRDQKMQKSQIEALMKHNTTDIWEAAERGSLLAIKFYFFENPKSIQIGNKNICNFTPLHYASYYGHFDICKFLISKKVKLNARSSANGTTPLMSACWNRNLSIMILLLDCGADVNQQDREKHTCLHRAVSRNYLDCVKLLIKRGADKTLKRNYNNETPLDMAKRQNKTSIVKYLNSI